MALIARVVTLSRRGQGHGGDGGLLDRGEGPRLLDLLLDKRPRSIPLPDLGLLLERKPSLARPGVVLLETFATVEEGGAGPPGGWVLFVVRVGAVVGWGGGGGSGEDCRVGGAFGEDLLGFEQLLWRFRASDWTRKESIVSFRKSAKHSADSQRELRRKGKRRAGILSSSPLTSIMNRSSFALPATAELHNDQNQIARHGHQPTFQSIRLARRLKRLPRDPLLRSLLFQPRGDVRDIDSLPPARLCLTRRLSALLGCSDRRHGLGVRGCWETRNLKAQRSLLTEG
jgi:hypothetical protein